MGLSEYNRLRAIAAEKAKLEAQQAPVETLEKIEPIEVAEIVESEDVLPDRLFCEAQDFLTGKTDVIPDDMQEITMEEAKALEAQKPKKKTDAEKLKRKK